MPRYVYTLTARTAVSAGQSDQRSNIRRAHHVVPGATVRGALAFQWWRTRDEDALGAAQEFENLFERDLLVGQAVPIDLQLISASSKICKYRPLPGCADVMQHLGVPGMTTYWSVCWVCGGPLTTDAGWTHASEGRATAVVARTRGALNDRETAEKGKLFTRQAVEGHDGDAVFRGMIQAPEEAAAWLNGLTIRLGGGRSLDYGNGTISVAEDPWPALPSGTEHMVRLVSPTILLDEFGGADVSGDALQRELSRVTGVVGLTTTTQPSWLRTDAVSGWHMRSRLPKVQDWALAPGSVTVVHGLTPEGWHRLQAGIGVRTLEGYGQVELIDPAHLTAEPENEGVHRLIALRRKVPKPRTWQGLKRTLLTTLTQLANADLDQMEAYRQAAQFPGLMGEVKAAARAVLQIPPAHISGTITKLEGMK